MNIWDSKSKIKFRNLKKWKEFRKNLLNKVGNKCQLCSTVYYGKRKRMLNIHHIYGEENYDILDEKRVVVVCAECHRLIEKFLLKFYKKSLTPTQYKSWKQLFLKNKIKKKKLIEKMEDK